MAAPHRQASGPRLPLEGVRIIAFEQYGAGPWGTLHLADMGAEIIKVENPDTGGDVARYVPPYTGDQDSIYFQSFNRSKKSITLNLKHPDAGGVLHRLAAASDAVFNNLRGDLPAKLGLDYDSLGAANPAIVCCSLSAFGRHGPRASEPGYDYIMQAYAGWMSHHRRARLAATEGRALHGRLQRRPDGRPRHGQRHPGRKAVGLRLRRGRESLRQRHCTSRLPGRVAPLGRIPAPALAGLVPPLAGALTGASHRRRLARRHVREGEVLQQPRVHHGGPASRRRPHASAPSPTG